VEDKRREGDGRWEAAREGKPTIPRTSNHVFKGPL
jgi:hypothetical protein